MFGKITRGLFAVLGAVLWLMIGNSLLQENIVDFGGWQKTIFFIVGAFLLAIIFYLISQPIVRGIRYIVRGLEKDVKDVPGVDLISGTIGLVVGLIVAFLLSQPILRLSVPLVGNALGVIISVIIYIVLGSLGMLIASQRKKDIVGQLKKIRFGGLTRVKKDEKEEDKVIPNVVGAKVLDTSVIIDGRIGEILEAGFLEGTLVIPQFVLEELQHIADSEDLLRRQRGRRGLDLIKAIQDKQILPIEITMEDYPEIKEVDMKLLRLTKDLSGKILTNDYNLNKVASVQGLKVLNINELANAVKPIVIPGEQMKVDVVKVGKERNQGIAYLDDGTMIVVEEGKFHIGEQLIVEVTSVLQTAAGKMIFAVIA